MRNFLYYQKLINLSHPKAQVAKPDLICRYETPPNPKSRKQNQTLETPPMQPQQIQPTP
jgi:hypothetical protein